MRQRRHDLEHAGLALALIALSCPAAADDGYRKLFGQASGSLPEADQKAVYAAMDLAASPDGAGFMFKDMGCPAFVFDDVTAKDLNGDGQPEVILLGGNTCTSGGNGSSLWLLTKSADGAWQTHLGFTAGAYTLLAETSQGFPDIRVGGMGWCEGVWRWDGKTYQHLRNVATQPGGCDQRP